MQPQFNEQEFIGRTVGRRHPPRGLHQAGRNTPADARDWQRAFAAPFVPRGVYRFASHEEADAWLWNMITRVRANSSRANPPSPTSTASATN